MNWRVIFVLESKARIISSKFSEILYFESRLRKILLVTETKSYEFYRNLNELITDLPKYYVQIHRSYVINIKKLQRF